MGSLTDLKLQKSLNFLNLNESRKEIVLFSFSDVYDIQDLYWSCCLAEPSIKNLGVLFDISLKFDKQINSVVKSCFYHIRLLLVALAPSKSLKKVIHAFISTQLD